MLVLVLGAVLATAGVEPTVAHAGAVARGELVSRAPRDPEKAARIAAFWSRVFAAPTDHPFELGLSGGGQLWQRAYGGYGSGWLLRLQARRSLAGLIPAGDWLGVTLLADYTSIAQHTTQLEVVNRQIMLGGGAGLLRWHGRVRFDAGLETGVLLLTSKLADGIGAARRGFRAAPAIGCTAGVGVALAGRSSVGLRGGVRYQPGRLHILVLLDVDWLVGASAAP